MIQQEFNILRALKHIALVGLAQLVLAALIVPAIGPLNLDRTAELFGRFLLPTLLLVFAASYAKQTGARAGFLFCATLALGLLLLPYYAVLTRKPVLSARETMDFEPMVGILCQRALGLSFVDPGAEFVDDPAGQRSLIEGIERMKAIGHGWAWAERGGVQRVTLQLLKMRASESEFRAFTGSLRNSIATNNGSNIRHEELDTTKPPYRYTLSFATEEAIEFDIICLSPTPSGKVDGIACLTTRAPHDALAKLRETFAFDSCG